MMLCPVCGSNQIETDENTDDEGNVTVTYRCTSCGWNDDM